MQRWPEDKRFEKHHGVDWKGTTRAILYTLFGKNVQGGSTITQQLVKNVTGDNQVTVKRKITEIYRALELEKRYEKDEILEAYLNEVYFGQRCSGRDDGGAGVFWQGRVRADAGRVRQHDGHHQQPLHV